MPCLSGFELYSRWVPLPTENHRQHASRGGYGSKGSTACCDCTVTLPTKRQQAVLRRTFLARFSLTLFEN